MDNLLVSITEKANALTEFVTYFASGDAWKDFVYTAIIYLVIAVVVFVLINTAFDKLRRAIRGLDISLIGAILAFFGYMLRNIPLLNCFSQPLYVFGLILAIAGILIFAVLRLLPGRTKKENEVVGDGIECMTGSGKRNKEGKGRVFLAVFLALLVGIAAGMLIEVKTDAISGDAIADSIESRLCNNLELSVKEYKYTETVSIKPESLKIKGYDIPFTEKTATVQFEGVAKLGPDMDKAAVKVNRFTKHVKIKLPHSQILSNEIDEDSFEILNEKNGLFNKLKLDDATKIRQKGKVKVEENIKTDGMLNEADKRASAKIKKFVEEAYTEYEVEIVFIEPEDTERNVEDKVDEDSKTNG